MGSRQRSANSPTPASTLQCLRRAKAYCGSSGGIQPLQDKTTPPSLGKTPCLGKTPLSTQARPLQPHLSGLLYQLPGLCTFHAQARNAKSAYSRGHLLPEAFPDYSAKPGQEGIPECSALAASVALRQGT